YLNRVTAVIAQGKRPVPFRTRKLSPTAPMVLHWRRCGRVGRRRTIIHERLTQEHMLFPGVPLVICVSSCYRQDVLPPVVAPSGAVSGASGTMASAPSTGDPRDRGQVRA